MEILKGIDAIGLAIYLKQPKILVFSDFHIGFEEALNKQGVLVPRFQYKDIISRLEDIFAKVQPETIVINGDLKHEFGQISKQEWKETLHLLDYLQKKCKHIVLVKGNHDTILGHLAEKRGLSIVDEFRIKNVLFIHGNKVPEKPEKTIIIGHEHPAIALREKGRVEKFKCFIVGKYGKCKLIVQPSFNLVVEGTDITKESLLSPLLKSDIADFEVFVVDDKKKEILRFGKLSDFADLYVS